MLLLLSCEEWPPSHQYNWSLIIVFIVGILVYVLNGCVLLCVSDSA